MSTKEYLVIRIGVSIECDEETLETSPTAANPRTRHSDGTVSASKDDGTTTCRQPLRSRSRAETPDGMTSERSDGISEAQRKALFRLALNLGDRDGALQRVLNALGVRRLDEATRAQASRAIDALKQQSNGRSHRPSHGARHA